MPPALKEVVPPRQRKEADHPDGPCAKNYTYRQKVKIFLSSPHFPALDGAPLSFKTHSL